jgi:hypothetical protein
MALPTKSLSGSESGVGLSALVETEAATPATDWSQRPEGETRPYQPIQLPQVYDPISAGAMKINARVDLGFRYDPAAQGPSMRLQNASAEAFTVSFHGDVQGVTLNGQSVEPNQSYVVQVEAEVVAKNPVSVHVRGLGDSTREASPDGNG